MMSTCFFAFTVLLVTTIFSPVQQENAIRSYVIQKDLIDGIKAGEFSVYDATEKQLQYRVESRYTFLQNVEVIAYPSKQVVAKLNKKLKLLLYKATISVLDPRTNQWIEGTIYEKFGRPFMIEWNEQTVKMEHKGILTMRFRNEKDGTLLAEYDKKLISLVWANKYELKVYSDKLPDAIYFLGLVARDHSTTQAAKTHGGK